MEINFTGDEHFFYALLLDYGITEKGVRIKNVAKIMTALENEFKKNSTGFLKHYGEKEQNQSDLENPSWSEIIDIERTTFNKGFAKIGLTYNLKSEFEQAIKDNSNSEPHYFYGRIRPNFPKLTFYYRNHVLLDSVIKAYLTKQEQSK